MRIGDRDNNPHRGYALYNKVSVFGISVMDILVALDRSDESQNALHRALEIAEIQDADVTAVHVEEDVSDQPATSDRTDDNDPPEQGESILEDAVGRALQKDIAIRTELLAGDPIEVVPEYAESNDFDVVYIGHRSLTQKGEPVTGDDPKEMGSVAKGIIENTSLPVMGFDKEI